MELGKYQYLAYHLNILSDLPLTHLDEIEVKKNIDLFVTHKPIFQNPTLELTKVYRRGLNAAFCQVDGNSLLLDWSPLMKFLAVSGKELIIDTTQKEEDLVSLFALSEALGMILFQRGYFLLHASCVNINDKAVVFLGEPGAGKSTIAAAFAKAGFKILSDDMVCIDVQGKREINVIPSFPQIKVWKETAEKLELDANSLESISEGIKKYAWKNTSTFQQSALPLNSFVIISAPKQIQNIQVLSSSQIPIELIKHFPLPEQLLKGNVLKMYFEKSILIAKHAKAFEVSRSASFEEIPNFIDLIVRSI